MELRDYLEILWRRRALIALMTLGVAIAALAASLAVPTTYAASATVVIPSLRMESYLAEMPADVLFEREMQRAGSQEVRESAASSLGDAPAADAIARVTVAPAAITSKATILFSATDSDRELAMILANAMAEAYVAHANETLAADAESYAAVTGSASDADAGLTGDDAERPIVTESARARGLTALEAAKARVVRGAAAATETRPSPSRSAALGLGLGLFLGIGTALVAEQLVGDRRDGAGSTAAS